MVVQTQRNAVHFPDIIQMFSAWKADDMNAFEFWRLCLVERLEERGEDQVKFFQDLSHCMKTLGPR